MSQPRPFSTLRKFVRPAQPQGERCELCGLALGPEHPHLLELATRRIACSCLACSFLFDHPESAPFRKIPSDVRPLREFQLTDAQWDALRIPISLAFFYQDSIADKLTAIYPSPAGAMEALLPLAAWPELVEANPVLKEVRPDVEALLVNRVGAIRETYLVPIDECFKLVGLIRTHWHGLSGGTEVWNEIEQFFARLRGPSNA